MWPSWAFINVAAFVLGDVCFSFTLRGLGFEWEASPALVLGWGMPTAMRGSGLGPAWPPRCGLVFGPIVALCALAMPLR